MFFVKRVVRVVKKSDPHICVVDAMVVSRQRAQGMMPQAWKVYCSDGREERIKAEAREFSSIGSGRYNGKPVTFFDGEPFLFTVESSIREAAENHIRLYLTCQSPLTTLPAFLSLQRGLQLRQYAVGLKLRFQNFAQLPDVQGSFSHYAWAMKNDPLKEIVGKMMAEFGLEPAPQEDDDSRSQQLHDYAAHALPAAGDCLPVEVTRGKRASAGVIMLQSEVKNGEVAAKLWLSDAASVHPGLILHRRVRWKDDEHQDVKLQIAEVTALL